MITIVFIMTLLFTHKEGSYAVAWIKQKPDNSLYAIWGSSPSDVFAAWEYGTITHYSGITNTPPLASFVITPYDENAEELELLRYFRDATLSGSTEGKDMIRLYYQWSSEIVKEMKEDKEFKEEIKGMIDKILLLMRKAE